MPENTVSLTALAHRSLGLGGRRGVFSSGEVAIAELRGGWLDGAVRFDLWGVDLPAVNGMATSLQADLFSDGLNLRRQGILQLKLVAATDQGEGAPIRWHKTLDYALLYEYRFADADGAASLIARIPIDGATDATPIGTTTVTDRMVRWDNVEAPVLEVTPHAARHSHALWAGHRGLSAGRRSTWTGDTDPPARRRRDCDDLYHTDRILGTFPARQQPAHPDLSAPAAGARRSPGIAGLPGRRAEVHPSRRAERRYRSVPTQLQWSGFPANQSKRRLSARAGALTRTAAIAVSAVARLLICPTGTYSEGIIGRYSTRRNKRCRR